MFSSVPPEMCVKWLPTAPFQTPPKYDYAYIKSDPNLSEQHSFHSINGIEYRWNIVSSSLHITRVFDMRCCQFRKTVCNTQWTKFL